MAETALEDRVQEEKGSESLEEKTNKTFLSRTFDLGYYALTATVATAVGIATVGPAAPVIGGGIAAIEMLGNLAKRDKSVDDVVKGSLKKYSAVNFILYPAIGFGNIVYPLIPNADLVGKAARTLVGMFAHSAVFLGLSRSASHLIENKLNPKGLVKKVTDNFMPEYLRLAFWFAPGAALYTNGIKTLPIMGYNASVLLLNLVPFMAYNMLNPLKKPEEKEKKVAHPAQAQKYAQPMRKTG